MGDKTRAEQTKRDISRRLESVRAASGLNQTEFARRYGISQSTWANYENANRNTPVDLLSQIGQRESVNLNWLISGRGDMLRAPAVYEPQAPAADSVVREADVSWPIDPASAFKARFIESDDDELVSVPIFETPLSAGSGADPGFSTFIQGYGSFMRRWLRRKAQIDPKKAFMAHVVGDSMVDLFFDGDLVLGEHVEEITRDDIYAVYFDGELYVKHVQRRGGTVVLKSRNAIYDPIEVPKEDSSLHVIGRIVCVLQRIHMG